jgi:hypothetical protein
MEKVGKMFLPSLIFPLFCCVLLRQRGDFHEGSKALHIWSYEIREEAMQCPEYPIRLRAKLP